jgi:hypothetical protein
MTVKKPTTADAGIRNLLNRLEGENKNGIDTKKFIPENVNQLLRKHGFDVDKMDFTAPKGANTIAPFQRGQKSPKETLNIAVVDHFQRKSTDLNGDGTADVAHGKMTQIYAADAAKKAGFKTSFSQYELGTGSQAAFEQLAKDIQSGKKFDGINVSSSLQIPLNKPDGTRATGPDGKPVMGTPSYQNLADSMYPGDKAKQDAFLAAGKDDGNFTPEQREDMKKFFSSDPSTKNEFEAFGKLMELAKERNIPVTLSAGNSNSHFNPFSLHEHATAVASTNKNGEKSGFSSKVTGDEAYGRGVYNVANAKGGVDVTGDGKADIGTGELSAAATAGGVKNVQSIVGKNIDSVKASEADYQAVADYFTNKANFFDENGTPRKEIQNVPKEQFGKVFDSDRLAQLIDTKAESSGWQARVTESRAAQQLRESVDQGGHVTYFQSPDGNGMNNAPIRVVNGEVQYDPAGEGKGKVINHTQGTSWAAPTALGEIAAANRQKVPQKA